MFTSVILAAGMGTRMKSKMPKVLHKVCGKPLSKWVIDASKAAGADKVCAVVGHKAETVKEVLGDSLHNCVTCTFLFSLQRKFAHIAEYLFNRFSLMTDNRANLVRTCCLRRVNNPL